MTSVEKLKRFLFKYRDLFHPPFKKGEIKYALEKIATTPVSPIECIEFQGMGYEPILLAKLISLGEFKNVQLLNAYKLIEIYLDKDEEWKSVSDIECDILVVTLGFAEFPNKQQGNIICQAIEQQIVRKKGFWLIVRGYGTLSSYPEVVRCLEERGFKRYKYSCPTTQVGGSDIQ